MGKHKPPKVRVPEMEALVEGMEDLLRDEHGNPLPPDHPHYQKFTNLVNQIQESMESSDDLGKPGQPKGNA